MRRGAMILGVLAFFGGWLSLGTPHAFALSQGTISGTISDADGPLQEAVVFFLGEANSVHTTTDANGHYSVAAWPDTYAVGVTPPQVSSDGYATEGGIVVTENAVTVRNVVLPPSEGTATLSGNVSYSDHAPDGGIVVGVSPLTFRQESYRSIEHYTDEGGNWDMGTLPAGTYQVGFVVRGNTEGFPPKGKIAAFETLMLGPGTNRVLDLEFAGPRPDGMLTTAVSTPEGRPSAGTQFTITPLGGGGNEVVNTDQNGNFRFWAPSGSYVLSGGEGLYGEGSATVTVSDGRLQTVPISLHRHALDVPPGTAARNEGRDVAWLNHQRERWGLPGGVFGVPEWSQACAAHDDYMALNHVLQHPEGSGEPGYSPGGAWAGMHSVLAGGGGWSLESNPWMDAPIHLVQLLTPSLDVIGLDDSEAYSCATTWPGLNGNPASLGTVFTFPGDGAAGLPPAELASESPTTPNRALGIPDLAGRQLFVYEEGFEDGHDRYGRLHLLSASLASSAGPVEIKWLDQESGLGGYLTGAIIVPVHPLDANTTYTASVTLAEGTYGQIPQVTHTWSFTTGPPNPNGYWSNPSPTPLGGQQSRHLPRPRLRLKILRVNRHSWDIHIEAGSVLLGRRALLSTNRERPLCKKQRVQSARGGCRWGWFKLGKTRGEKIMLHRHSSFRLHLDDWQRASVGVFTRPFSAAGRRYAATGASTRVFGPKPRGNR
jgi:hypothetical protein